MWIDCVASQKIKNQFPIYCSPDIIGVGEVVGHVKDFIFKIIDYKDSKKKKELDIEEQNENIQHLRLENELKRIEIAYRYTLLAKECGYSESEIREEGIWEKPLFRTNHQDTSTLKKQLMELVVNNIIIVQLFFN